MSKTIHDDSVADANELRDKLGPIREQLWKGHDIPYVVAIDGGGPQEVPGRHHSVQGMTTAAYGVPGWPTYVLIDREGLVRRRFIANKPEHLKLLESLLSAPAP